MPVTADFLAPVGEIEPGFFPKDSAADLAARIAAYIAAATAKVDALDLDAAEIDIDAAIMADVYVRLYDAILLRIANTPDTTIADEGGVRYGSAQIKIFEDKRAEWAGAYEAILADVAVPPSEQPSAPTTSAPVIFGF